jgi:uncharacterized protein
MEPIMKIWFDADNGPHALIMKPLAEYLTAMGHDVRFTARNRTSTCQLLDLYGLKYKIVGGEYRSGMVGKVAGTLIRAWQLFRTMRGWRPDVSFGHASRSLPIASWLMRVPTATMYDYEWINTTLFNLFSSSIMLPRVIGHQRAEESGVKTEKVRFYDGLKEELYVTGRELSAADIQELGLKPEKVKILLRPPATTAHYHNPESEKLLDSLLSILLPREDVQIIVIPRTPDQLALFPKDRGAEIIVPQRVFDGPGMIAACDMVISGGGTMVREAAVLGVPAYSFFRGRTGNVDQWLEDEGRLILLRSPDEVAEKLQIVNKSEKNAYPLNENIVAEIAAEILAAAD